MTRWFIVLLLFGSAFCLLLSPVAAGVIEVEIDADDRVLYDEHAALSLNETFNASTVPVSTNVTYLQRELGTALYQSVPGIHEEILSAYRLLYPNLSSGTGDSFVYTFGQRLQVAFLPHGLITTKTSSVHDPLSLSGEKKRTAVLLESSSDRGEFFGRPATTSSTSMVFEYDGVNPPVAHPVERAGGTSYTNWTEEGGWSTRNYVSEEVLLGNNTVYTSVSLGWNAEKGPKNVIGHVIRFTCTPYGGVSSSSGIIFIGVSGDTSTAFLSILADILS